MNTPARQALATVGACIAAGRVILLEHFRRRMDERAMVWADVLAVIDDPADVRGDGHDDWGRPRWVITGRSAGDDAAVIVCVIGRNKAGQLAVFVTMFWEKP